MFFQRAKRANAASEAQLVFAERLIAALCKPLAEERGTSDEVRRKSERQLTEQLQIRLPAS